MTFRRCLVAAAAAVALLAVAVPLNTHAQEWSTGEKFDASHSAPRSSVSKPALNLPHLDDCGCPTVLNACNSKCALNSANDERVEIQCRQTCLLSYADCSRECIEQQSKKSPLLSRTPPVHTPRPASENRGYGPETVKNFAGFITVNSTLGSPRNLFFWLFESRNEPTKDPLVIWLTGGPGCSSLMALFTENGPYIIDPKTLDLSLNPYSWNSNATVIWVDQPVWTGYSYGMKGDLGVTSETEIADNMYQFLTSFLVEYSEYSELPFFITGESYAGHYIPALATRILTGNQEGGVPQINLQAIAIGNGLVDPLTQYAEYLPFANVTGAVGSFGLEVMELGLPGCLAAIESCANSTLGKMLCFQAVTVCNLAEMVPFQTTRKNPYDIREQCAQPPLCYDFNQVSAFLAQPQVVEALGVQNLTWQDCSRGVEVELTLSGDFMQSFATNVATSLAAGVRVIAYSGEYDFVCNWYGGNAWTNALEWPGQQAFVSAANTTWVYQGEEAGSARTAQGFTFVRVKDAGHLVPFNQPERALDLLARVISGAPFDDNPVEVRPRESTVAPKETIALE